MSRRLSPAERQHRDTTERQVQDTLAEALDLLGYEWFHDQALAYAKVRANRAGFPDLCAVHPVTHRVIFAEVKRETGKLTDAQERWKAALTGAHDLDRVIYLEVRPSTLQPALEVIQMASSR